MIIKDFKYVVACVVIETSLLGLHGAETSVRAESDFWPRYVVFTGTLSKLTNFERWKFHVERHFHHVFDLMDFYEIWYAYSARLFVLKKMRPLKTDFWNFVERKRVSRFKAIIFRGALSVSRYRLIVREIN